MDGRVRFSSRKFWIVEQAIILTFALAWFGKLTAEWSGVISVCVGAYVGVNGYVEGKRLQKNGE